MEVMIIGTPEEQAEALALANHAANSRAIITIAICNKKDEEETDDGQEMTERPTKKRTAAEQQQYLSEEVMFLVERMNNEDARGMLTELITNDILGAIKREKEEDKEIKAVFDELSGDTDNVNTNRERVFDRFFKNVPKVNLHSFPESSRAEKED